MLCACHAVWSAVLCCAWNQGLLHLFEAPRHRTGSYLCTSSCIQLRTPLLHCCTPCLVLQALLLQHLRYSCCVSL